MRTFFKVLLRALLFSSRVKNQSPEWAVSQIVLQGDGQTASLLTLLEMPTMPTTVMPWPTVSTGGCRVFAHLEQVPVEILLVEDSPGDAELMCEALRESELHIRVKHIEDGQEAIEYLRKRRLAECSGWPDLILLDLHLPRKSGQEILAEIKQDERLRAIPVIIMTSFGTDEVIQGAYDLHANCCVAKPSNLEQFTLTVKKIESFWLQQARLRHNHL